MTAAETGLEEFVDELLRAGADPDSKNLVYIIEHFSRVYTSVI